MNMGLMTNRDALIEVNFSTNDKGELISIVQSIKRDSHPEVKGRIRMEMLKASRCRDTDNGLEVIEFSNMDMKGYFPMKMMNMVMGSAIAKSIPDLHKNMVKYKA